MNLLAQFIVDWLREYGPTSVAIFDLSFCEDHLTELMEEMGTLIERGIIVNCDGRKVGGKRPIPAIALKDQLI